MEAAHTAGLVQGCLYWKWSSTVSVLVRTSPVYQKGKKKKEGKKKNPKQTEKALKV